jgi:hypothetical protein
MKKELEKRYVVTYDWRQDSYSLQGYFYRYDPVPGISKRSHSCKWRSQSMAEKRQWYDYENQMKENGFTPRMRRTAPKFITTYDDWPKNHYRGSWKQSTKKRRQWGGTVQLIYVG